MKIQISPQRLYQERTNSLVLAQEIQGVNDALAYTTMATHWSGSSHTAHVSAWQKLQGVINDLQDALELSSSQLAEAAAVYEHVDQNSIK